MSTLIPSGSKIVRVYFEIDPFPGSEQPVGEKFDLITFATDEAADYWIGRRQVYREQGLPELPPFPTIVERWVIEHARPRGAAWASSTTYMAITADTLTESMVRVSRISRGLEP
jgi:hypothetical protein